MTEPRYRWRHQQLRKALLPRAYGTPCHFCGQPMLPGQHLDLDHTPDATGYRGITHRRCNRSDGATRGNLTRRRTGTNPISRHW